MKKIFSILLLVALTVSTVFASFSGEASIGVGANLDNGNYGFIDSAAKVKLDLELATDNVEKVSEGDVYASIKATLAFKLSTGDKKINDGDPTGSDGIGNYLIADITEAKIGGANWYVSILGMPSAMNYAKSAIDTYTVKKGIDKYGFDRDDFDENASYGLPYNKTNGVEVGVYDYKFGVGLLGDYSSADTWKFEDNFNLALYAETPEYDFDGLKVQAGTVYSYKTIKEIKDGKPEPTTKANALGASASVAFDNGTLSAKVATDIGFDFTQKEAKDMIGADVAANFTYDFVTVDGYYATSAVTGKEPVLTAKDEYTKSYTEHLLSAQAKFDLNSFDVPVALTVGVSDIIAKQAISAKAEVSVIEGLKLTVKGGYTIDDQFGRVKVGDTSKLNTEKHDNKGKWNAGLDAEYTADLFTAKAGFGLSQKLYNDEKVKIAANASIESTTLIPGATVKLAWAGDDLSKATAVADEDNGNFGKVTASVKIAF